MGELAAILSAASFAAANASVKKGTTRLSQDNGAFLSIVLTGVTAGAIFVGVGLVRGWPDLPGAGLLWFAAAGVLTSFAGRTLLYASIQHLGSVRAASVKRLNPVFTVLVGVIFLGEPVTPPFLAGMALICGSFLLLALRALRAAGGGADGAPAPGGVPDDARKEPGSGRAGYLYGPFSALAYASGYALRKQGLAVIADPYLGAMVGALAGALAFVGMSRVLPYYGGALRSALGKWQPWLFAAGVATSLGQILYFVALTFLPVSRVALLTSTELVFTLLLAGWVVRTGEALSGTTVAALALSLAGALLVAVA